MGAGSGPDGEEQSPPQLIARDPEVRADDYAPALWVPLSRLIRARRRVSTMLSRMGEAWWAEASACAGWSRRDVLAHLVAWDGQHLRSLDAVLAGAPLEAGSWVPDLASAGVGREEWNATSIAERADAGVEELGAEFEAVLERLLDLWSELTPDQLLQGYGFAPNVLAGVDGMERHVDGHAQDIINGPSMMR